MLSNRKLTRRTFLKASAATTALISIGTIEYTSWQTSYANDNDDIKVTSTLCNACSNKCGIMVTTKNGRIWKVKGHPDHPMSKGTICARGHGYATIAYSPDRLTQPFKKGQDGKLMPITWDQAYQEIGQKLNKILAKDGPGTVVYVEDPRPTGHFYGPRFLAAIGSPNYFTHQTVCSNSRDTGFKHVLGGVPGADVANSKYIMFIGRSYGDGVRPSSLHALIAGRENGAKVVIVDPRLNSTANMADEWLSIRPGTDLALVLAMTNVVISEDLYDKEFVKNYSIGFEQYAEEVKKYTPEWAEKITGISKDTIIRIARDMAKVKPQALIEPSWRGAFGCTYFNSSETARSIAAFNALLGNIQQKGGLTFGIGPKLGDLDEMIHPAPLKSNLPRVDDKDYPVAPKPQGVANIVPMKAKEGKVKAAFIIQTNPVRNYSNPKAIADGLQALELNIVIDIQMTETALIADYVLPEPSYLERDDVLEGLAGGKPGVSIRQKVIERVHPETRPADEIFTEIAKAIGVGQYFNFTVDELNTAKLKPLGISLADMKKKGTVILGESVTLGTVPTLKTPSGKVEFYSETMKNAGFSPVPTWLEPKVMPDKDSFRLITGKQSYHTHSFTTNLPYLMQITKDTDGERLWINRERANKLGINDGDLVIVESKLAESKVRVKVTDRLHPECVYVPSPYGSFSEHLNTAKGVGFSYNDHVNFELEPMSGSGMVHEVVVKVRKVGI